MRQREHVIENVKVDHLWSENGIELSSSNGDFDLLSRPREEREKICLLAIERIRKDFE